MISIRSRTGCYAVLASLSGRYPPLEGRSPTCYSPVRHSVSPCGETAFDLHVLGTPPALILSQDQTLKFNLLERAFDFLLFSNFVTSVLCCPCHRPRSARIAPPLARRGAEALTLDGLVAFSDSASLALGFVGCCTLYLVFKEPRTPGFDSRSPPRTRHPIAWILLLPFLGEPFKLTTTYLP